MNVKHLLIAAAALSLAACSQEEAPVESAPGQVIEAPAMTGGTAPAAGTEAVTPPPADVPASQQPQEFVEGGAKDSAKKPE